MGGFQSVVPGPAALTSPGDLLELQILGSRSRPPASGIWGFCTSNLFYTGHLNDYGVC